MADIDLKAATPDTSIPSGAFFIGADSQSADAPSVYPIAAVEELIRDTIGAALAAGTNVSVTVNDAGDTITISGLADSAIQEIARDALGTALVAGTGITITPNDGADTITIAASGGGGGLLDNTTATSAPTAGDDSGDGYAVGSRWLWAARGQEWTAVDVSAGAAVWRPVYAAYGRGSGRLPVRQWFCEFTEFNSRVSNSVVGNRWFQNSFGGTISNVASPFGIVEYGTSTSATGASGVFQTSSFLAVIPDASLTHRFRAAVAVNPSGNANPPDGTETYNVRVGFSDDNVSPNQMARFVYQWSGSAVELLAQTRNGGTITSTSLTLPTNGAYHVYEVVMVGTTSVLFYIDGVLVATHTTNLPTTGMSDVVQLRKTAGTSARVVRCDWVEYEMEVS